MGIFGWSYPSGCDGPPDDDAICDICEIEAGSCTCPVCPVCGVQGDPKCYREHGLEAPEPGDNVYDLMRKVGRGRRDAGLGAWPMFDDT